MRCFFPLTNLESISGKAKSFGAAQLGAKESFANLGKDLEHFRTWDLSFEVTQED